MRDSQNPRMQKHFKMSEEESRRTATAEEVKRGVVADPDTRALDRSSSSVDVKPATEADVESSTDRMDEDSELLQPRIRWNLTPKKSFPRKHESQETYFTFTVKTS